MNKLYRSGGLIVKNLPCNTEDMGSIPGRATKQLALETTLQSSHTTTQEAHTPQQKILHTAIRPVAAKHTYTYTHTHTHTHADTHTHTHIYIYIYHIYIQASLVAQTVRSLLAVQETWVWYTHMYTQNLCICTSICT